MIRKKILVIAPHADDEVLVVVLTLARTGQGIRNCCGLWRCRRQGKLCTTTF
jgi:hypothetical protein